ncbi:hypothetical protein CONCODRAFT_3911 [Conidiobolus coronatus NRRL 28638]|uniref:HAD-like protein n=1 Tax=Conidiobolus coronatus (strain ATCC 28846 / CBS 209.66 / NRRL 28638) TaxID=796925 RepID=A0A137PE12_CONC2|nr:hypothetical protein CONCODRAFT_3911 [Conidiobolus coronatus NRRL 28638]|eukprot:KXN73236.1 hypothetical protein CONCODRAFT_3911 [Conidiobolus coronatus NRRL 28638]
MPFNPTSKRTQATVVHLESNESFKVSKGAPPTMIKLVGGHDEAVHAVNDLAGRGLRALGVARTFPGKPDEWHLVGMISLLDPPRPDSADTVRRCHEYGVDVKMITGDQLIIAKEVAHRLGMQRAIFQRMRSYSLYRITSTIHILIFFFAKVSRELRLDSFIAQPLSNSRYP